jgi:molybdenum cofactor cytidylyltransferase
VHNPNYAQGLSTSLKAGIAAAPPSVAGVLVLLGDMPLIAPGHLDQLIAAFRDRAEFVIVPAHAGKRGNPVLWPRAFFAAMLGLEGDAGAKRLLATNADCVREVDLGTDAIFLDVDTAEALAQVRGSETPRA